jgi:hypothetical protein
VFCDKTANMRARVGKIARLPASIREGINQQLFNGLRASRIVSWLSTLPEAQSIVAEQFAGVPISENNISEWRRGGYQDWLLEKQSRTETVQFVQKCLRMNPEDRLRYLEGRLIAEFDTVLRALRDIPDPELRMRQFQGLSRQFIRLKNLHTFGLQSELIFTRNSKRCQPPNTP